MSYRSSSPSLKWTPPHVWTPAASVWLNVTIVQMDCLLSTPLSAIFGTESNCHAASIGSALPSEEVC